MSIATQATPDHADLFAFAWIPPSVDAKLEELALKAQPERWGDPDGADSRKFPILRNYVKYTFRQVWEQDKVAEADDEAGRRVAAFNTGLFTANYEQIFATFEANTNAEKQPWVLKDWNTLADFRMRPFASIDVKPARYFKELADLIYDPDLELAADLDHILDENADRFPEALRDNPQLRRNALDGAIREAGKRAQMNWKTAVPQYYFGHGGRDKGRIQLLLPLCIMQPERPDLAIVVEKAENGKRYRAHTVLTLPMAYNNARLIARPDSDWLSPLPVGSQEGASA